MIVHALHPQCALFVLSYSECKIAKIFWGFAPGPHWRGLILSSTTVFLLATLVQKTAPPKNCWIRHCKDPNSEYWYVSIIYFVLQNKNFIL